MLSWLTDLPQRVLGHGIADGIPRLSGAIPFLGHGVSFGNDALSLVERGRRELGEVFGLEHPSGPITVITDGRALSSVPRLEPLAELRRSVAGEDHWAPGFCLSPTAEPLLDKLLAPATLRLQVERVVSAVESKLDTWPDRGERSIHPTMAELAASAVTAAVWRGASDAVRQGLVALSCEGPSRRAQLAALLPVVSGFRASSLCRPLETDARRAGEVALPKQVGQRDLVTELMAPAADAREVAQLLDATLRLVTPHLTVLSTAFAAEQANHTGWMDGVLEEQDRVHGDQGDPTFETLRAATRLEQELVRLELRQPIQRLLLARLEENWRLSAVVLPRGTRILLYRSGGSELPCWTAQHRLEQGLSRLLAKVLWSVLWRELDMELTSENTLRYTRRD